MIGLRSDYVISDTDVLFSGKQTKILTVRTCLVVGGRNVTNNEDIYIHSVRSTEDIKQPWSIVLHVKSNDF